MLIAAGPDLDPGFWDTARHLAGELDTILLSPTGVTGSTPGFGYLHELAATEDAGAFAGELPRSDDLAAFFHTGGTTGTPKLAAHRHRNEVADAWMPAACSLFETESVVFAALPLFHVNAVVVTLLAPLFKGQHVVWAGSLGYRDFALHREFWRIVERYRISTMSAVPTVLRRAGTGARGRRHQQPAFRHRRRLIAAAAVRQNYRHHTGIALLEGYGLTEATCASARSFPDALRPGAVGQRLPQDLIIRGGHNVDPALIEDALLAHPQVTAAAVGRPDAHAGEVPVAYVTLTPGATVTEDDFLAWAAAQVPERAAAPKTVTVMDALPVTAVGKPYKLDLRADATRRAIADALRETAPDSTVDTRIDDGSVVVTVTVPADSDQAAVKAALGAFTVRWDLRVSTLS
ncbi:AMP-binding enzyme C-terminal domain-containing protein [Lentzea albidocapillata subsp. violacea]|uniref:AMP-binding enzyme C-terminal domain-containing protein n=1 Tax=Lentzea albidocapillata subsp. violacea TaxID=128104 RepID=A0A1G9IQA1_9PSEU|nr:AMP-binding enzyme C-terminal domain-containing protein [Lentzea albidocapillata subsp. violacea]